MSHNSMNRILDPVGDWLRYHFLEKKLNTWLGFVLIGLLSTGLAYLTVVVNFAASIGGVGFFMMVLFLILFIKYPAFTFYFLVAYSSITPVLGRYGGVKGIDIAFGVFTDFIIYLALFSTVTKDHLRKKVDPYFWKNPIMMAYLGLYAYYILEGANPNMFSLLGWASFLRKNLSYLFFFYLCYALLYSWEKMKAFINFSLILTTLLAIYACKQQWFGLADFEMESILRTPGQYGLLMQGGLLRKYSTLTDPSCSGILFSAASVQCLILFLRSNKLKTRFWLFFGIIFNLLAYGYSGTRTATMMIVAGIFFYSIATLYERRTLIFVGGAVFMFTILMTMPFSPPSINRIRSTFNGTKDASANIRDVDRHMVQPYLYQHPIGGGIFTAVNEGMKYNPGHYLSNFSPDSGYMKIFAEQGVIGLALAIISYGIILIFGVNNFYKIRNPDIQNQYIALLVVIFMIMVAQYSQMAMNLEPQVYFYMAALVLFIKSPNYDKETSPAETV